MEGGRRGMIVVFSAFMIQLLALGNSACIGIYTVHLLQAFNNDIVGVSLLSSIHFGALFGLGPVTTMILTKMKYRTLCLVGAALVSPGLLCVYLLPQLKAMYIFFSVFCGVGGLFIYLPSHVMSGLYYDKHRTLSTGIASAGMAMGAFVMPFVVGSFLVLSGIQLHLFIFAMFMKPPPDDSTLTSQKLSNPNDENRVSDDGARNDVVQTTMMKPLIETESSLKVQSNEYADISDTDNQQCVGNGIIHPNHVTMKSVITHNSHCSSGNGNSGIGSSTEHSNSNSNQQIPESQSPTTAEKVTRKRHSSLPNSEARPMRSHIQTHFEVLKNFKCLLYLLSTFTWALTYTFFMTFGPVHIYKQGHSAKNTAFLFTFYGLGQVTGCVVFSAAGNFIGRRLILYCVSCVLTGGLVIIVPLVQTFDEFAILLTGLGLPFGGILGLSFIVIIDVLGSEKMAVGLAYLLLATGAGCFVGPILGAYLEKVWGTYVDALYLSGCLAVFAGLIVLPVFIQHGCRPKYRKSNSEMY